MERPHSAKHSSCLPIQLFGVEIHSFLPKDQCNGGYLSCQGETRYREMGDSVPKHTGPIVLTDTSLEPSVSRTRPTTTRENRRRWKGLILRNTQAACRFNCLASKFTPFFQRINVMAAIFRARVRRAIVKWVTRCRSTRGRSF